MNRQLLFTVLFLGCGGLAFGQSLPQKSEPAKSKGVKANILRQQCLQTGAKGTAGVNERMTGASSYQGDIMIDSAHYVYSGSRYTAVTNMDLASYQDNFIPTSEDAPMAFGSTITNYFGYDTMRYYAKVSGGLVLRAIANKTYDSEDRAVMMNVKNFNTAGVPMMQRRFYVDYTGTGEDISQTIGLIDTSGMFTGMFDTGVVLNVSYLAPGQREKDATHFPMDNLYQQIHYGYNSAGLISTVYYTSSADGASFDTASRSVYTYDESNRLIEGLDEVYDGIAWTPDYLDSFGYTGSSPLYTYNKSFTYGGGWVPEYQFDGILRTDFTAYDTVVITQDNGMGMMPLLQLKMLYNANEHVTRMVYYLTDGAGGFEEDSFQEVNYYYGGPVSVPEVAAKPVVVSLYPNPAGKYVLLEGTGLVRASVYNLSGQLLFTQSGNAAGRITLQIAHLPAGTYLATVQTEKGSKQVKFVKQ